MAQGDYRNNGETTGRDASGRFTEGNPGRPRGARHKATRAALALLEDGECIRPVDPPANPQGGRPQRLFTVNPAILGG